MKRVVGQLKYIGSYVMRIYSMTGTKDYTWRSGGAPKPN